MRAVHFVEIRNATQTLWTSRSMGALPNWSSGQAPGGPSLGTAATPIRASDMNDLRRWFDQYEAEHTLLFDSNRPIAGQASHFAIYTKNLLTMAIEQLFAAANDPSKDTWWPRLSPDRTQILFLRTPQGTHDSDDRWTELWRINYDGTGLEALITRQPGPPPPADPRRTV